ncbi:50S ribosomal protein L31 type B [Symmachiella macrocystis]|uniref:Large ribosomal subunit protein bL31B n=1 Tax=Symmachiella macrocystis TaxID=2527985 RepID=A0A5C6BNG9_9PLAN|nr:type B 50S ribosomal protein L31 [Symmachiella macrocystis]TWU12981.1 50S ribosomal protein L31 type B [Symmachiella macrocystis]
MKADVHPDYHEVVFLDASCGEKFLTRSTLKSDKTIEWEDGKTYPLITVPVSAASHPFYTGKAKYVDSAGRVEKFQQKYGWDERRKGSKAKDDAAAENKTEEAAAEG